MTDQESHLHPLHSLVRQPAHAVGLPPLPPLSVIALNRMAFGPRPGDLAAFDALPGATAADRLQAYVDQQLNPAAIDDSDCNARIASANLPTLSKTLIQLWSDHYLNINGDYNLRVQPIAEVRAATLLRAVYSKRQLVEVLADFWHNHFNVNGWDYEYASATFAQYDRDVIRGHLLGNFRQMLEAVGASTAMLFYLNNYTNSNAGPNENYAREMFELHTMGAENYLGVLDPTLVPKDGQGRPTGYVDNDVYEAARCFTGWRVNDDANEAGVQDTGTFLYYSAWHDRFNKFVLSTYLAHDQADMKDGRDVYDLVAAHPGTGRYIARKLCRRLISDDPPQSVVDAAASVFTAQKDAPDQLKQVVRTILLSSEFQSTWGQKIKRPFEVAVSMLRAIDMDFTALPDDFFWNYDQMGQPLFEHHAPNGYPDVKDDWDGTMSILKRWSLANAFIEGWIASDTITLSVDLLSQMPVNVTTPNQIADFWIGRILGRPMVPESSRTELVSFVAQGRNPDYDLPAGQRADLVPRMVALILMSPDFQWR